MNEREELLARLDARLEDLAEANALFGKDHRLGAPDKIARNDREISWLKDLRSMIVLAVAQQAADCGAWYPIESYNPAWTLNVLVSDNGVVSEAYYDGESDAWFKEGKSEHDFDFVDSDRLFPTHWMPMPKGPELPSTDRGGA